MTDKINNKTNIVERRHAYNKIVNVKIISHEWYFVINIKYFLPLNFLNN